MEDEKPEVKVEYKPETQEDHIGHIAELARSLSNVSPSGAETVRDKILERVGAIQDPKSYDELKAAEFKAEQELEDARAKERAKLKTAKVA